MGVSIGDAWAAIWAAGVWADGVWEVTGPGPVVGGGLIMFRTRHY